MLAAAAATHKSAVTTMATPPLGALVAKMVLIVGVLALVAWYMRRRNAAGRAPRNANSPRLRRLATPGVRPQLNILSRQSLGKGSCLAVVDWEGRQVLVGITPAGISFYNDANESLLETSLRSNAMGLGDGAGFSLAPAESDFAANNERIPVSAQDRQLVGALASSSDSSAMATGESAGSSRPTFLEALRDLSVRR
jgi:flagellar biogenesis protein FliO